MKQYWACVGLLAVISSFTMGQEVVVVEEGGAVAADAAADEGMTDLPTTKAPRGNVKARSKRMTDLYLRTYGKHLEKNDWITRAMAVVSLCRIHDSRVVEQLLKTLQGDPDPRVRAYAWEALRMRDGDLTKEQRADWLQQGRMLVLRDKVLNGRLRTGLMKAVVAEGPTPENRQLFRRLFATSNLLYGPDRELIDAMQNALAKWKDKQLISDVIGVLSDPNNCYRAEYVLRGLQGGLPTADDLHAIRKPLGGLWQGLQGQYRTWLATLEEATPASGEGAKGDPLEAKNDGAIKLMWGRASRVRPGPAYGGGGFDASLMPTPEPILNPDDPKWRRDLELPRFRLNQLSVALVMDATGSMSSAIEWIRRDVGKIMRALHAVSQEPRLGVTLYRDSGEDYVVKLYPLTSKESRLSQALRRAKAEGGGDFPEAVYEALRETIENGKQNWPISQSIQKVVVVIGDAPPHREDMPKIEELLKKATAMGFMVYCLKVPPMDLARAKAARGGDAILDPDEAFDQIATWGGGKSYRASFQSLAPAIMVPTRPIPYLSSGGVAEEEANRLIVAGVLMGLVRKEYQDRVRPFVNVLLEILETSPPERREYREPPPLQPGRQYERRDQDNRPPRPPRPPQPYKQ